MRLLVIGAGGHAKVVIDAARLAGFEVVAALGQPGSPEQILGVPVVFDVADAQADAFIVAIGDNAKRAQAYRDAVGAGLTPATVVHPSAIVADGVSIGGGTVLAAGVIVNVDARIGENAVLNTGCSIDHDVVIGDHAHIAPRTAVCGGARIGEGALIGVGSCMIPLVSVGDWALIGAGAAVISDVPANAIWAGVPARPLRDGEDA